MVRQPRRLAGIGASDLPNASAFDAYVGPAREVTVDPQRGIVALHDGATPGGKRVGSRGRAILVFASGQSNMARYEALSWSPPANLLLWNHDPMLDAPTHVGTGFNSVPPDKISVSWAFAAEIANANPDKTVYVVNTAKGGEPIAKWLSGGSPDMYAAGKANIEAALIVIGQPVKIIHLWWQGEADAMAGSSTYEANFLTYRGRLDSEAWWRADTSTLIFGVSPYMSGANGVALRGFNKTLALCAAQDPERLRYIHSGQTGAAASWDASGDNLHVSAAGHGNVGRMAYNVLFAGTGRGTLESIVVDPETKQLLQPKKFSFLGTKTSSSVGVITGYTESYSTPGSGFDAAGGTFTVPISGLWSVDTVAIGAAAASLQVQRNGANLGLGSAVGLAASSSSVTNQVTTTVKLTRGDIIRLSIISGSLDAVRFAAKFEG